MISHDSGGRTRRACKPPSGTSVGRDCLDGPTTPHCWPHVLSL
ncbi:hypothetical protein [Ornithinimicrobium kibberense]